MLVEKKQQIVTDGLGFQVWCTKCLYHIRSHLPADRETKGTNDEDKNEENPKTDSKDRQLWDVTKSIEFPGVTLRYQVGGLFYMIFTTKS